MTTLSPLPSFDKEATSISNGAVSIDAVYPLEYNIETSSLSIQPATNNNSGVVTTLAQNIAGLKTFTTGIKLGSNSVSTISIDGNLTSDSDSVLSTQKAIKQYVDTKVAIGVSWMSPVKDFWDPTGGLPVGPVSGDRLIASQSANGWLKNYIYTYTTEWIDTEPTEGDALYIDSQDSTFIYDNTNNWIHFGLTIDHNDLQNKGTNTHSDIDNHISDSTTAHFGQNLTSTGNPTFDGVTTSSIALLQGGLTGVIGTNEYGDIILSPDVDAFVEVTGSTKLKVSAPLLTVNRIGNTSGVTTTIEADGASADVILTSIGTGAKIDMKVNDDNQTDNTLETITKSQHTIYLDADATNSTDGSVHLAGGMSVTKSIHTASSVNCNSVAISTGGATCYGDVSLLNGNQKIRFTSSNESNYPSSFIEKNAETNLTLRNNGLSNGDYYKDAYGQTVVNLGSTGLSVSTAPASVFPAVERITVDATSVSVKLTTSSTNTSTGSITTAGGMGVAGDIYANKVNVVADVWEDIPLLGQARIGATAPTFGVFNSTAVYAWSFSGSADNELHFQTEIPHSCTSGRIVPHLHYTGAWTTIPAAPNNTSVWWLTAVVYKADGEGTETFNETLTVTMLPNNSAYSASHVVNFTELNLSAYPSGSVMIRLKRKAVSDASDTFTSAIWLLSFSLHYKVGALGSTI